MNVLSLSYGKDSLACIGACELLDWRIDRIVHAEVWATDTISADLPPMVEFKKKADKIIKERWGIEVEHFFAIKDGYKNTYDKQFNQKVTQKCMDKRLKKWEEPQRCHNDNGNPNIYGFPIVKGAWCNSMLKMQAINQAKKSIDDCVSLIGIAIDEPNRFHNLDKKNKSPLVEIGWTEADCKQWCIDNDLLSPIYTDECTRGGCWFCHNQGVNQLRQLRHNYPELWELLLKWDSDSPVTFHADGHTVHDFDKRFRAEDEGFIDKDNRFFWNDLNMQQYNIYHYFDENGNFKTR